MHSVIPLHCTGCELCLPACPVDCIQMVNASGNRTGWNAWSTAEADHARIRYENHSNRLNTEKHQRTEKPQKEAATGMSTSTQATTSTDPKKAAIAAALARARAQRATPPD